MHQVCIVEEVLDLMAIEKSGSYETKGAGFGEEACQKWLTALPEASQKIYRGQILPSLWYNLHDAMAVPQNKLIEMFYHGDAKQARVLGRWLADQQLSGIYKLFVKMGSPQYIISKAKSVMSTFYRPAALEAVETSKTHFIFRVTEFSEFFEILEEQIAGWCERALELSGGQNGTVVINTSIAKGDAYTEYELHWEL